MKKNEKIPPTTLQRIFVADIVSNPNLKAKLFELKKILATSVIKFELSADNSVLTVESPQHLFSRINESMELIRCNVDIKHIKEYLETEEYYFKIDLADTLSSHGDIVRTVARIIGEKGSVKKKIEEISGAKLFVNQTSILVLGDYGSITNARRCVEEIITGKPQDIAIKNLRRAALKNLDTDK
jgi:rRNA processing protein Krr1/Pno1